MAPLVRRLLGPRVREDDGYKTNYLGPRVREGGGHEINGLGSRVRGDDGLFRRG